MQTLVLSVVYGFAGQYIGEDYAAKHRSCVVFATIAVKLDESCSIPEQINAKLKALISVLEEKQKQDPNYTPQVEAMSSVISHCFQII